MTLSPTAKRPGSTSSTVSAKPSRPSSTSCSARMEVKVLVTLPMPLWSATPRGTPRGAWAQPAAPYQVSPDGERTRAAAPARW